MRIVCVSVSVYIPFDEVEEKTESHTTLITERNTKQQNAKAQEKLFVNLRKAKKKSNSNTCLYIYTNNMIYSICSLALLLCASLSLSLYM